MKWSRAASITLVALIGLLIVAGLAFRKARLQDSGTSHEASSVASTDPSSQPTETPPKPMPSTFTPEPYPRPRRTAGPTSTPDPTRVALTSDEWAEELRLLWIEAGDRNPYVDGPIEIMATADVFPADFEPELPAWIVEQGVVPDVAVVMKGVFRSNPREPEYACALLIGDRDHHGAYSSQLSDDCDWLIEKLPPDRAKGTDWGSD